MEIANNKAYKSYKETETNEKILYFGYGSNINSTTHKWRQIKVESKTPCILYDYRLTFDVKAYAFVEGSFANIRACPGECVHGVGMEMSKKEFITNVINTESPHYQIKDIKVTAYDKTQYNAITLLDYDTDGTYNYPSRRYLDLIVNGAEENHLDDEYVVYLKKFPDIASSLTLIGMILKFFFMIFYFWPFIGFLIWTNLNRKLNLRGLFNGGYLHKVLDIIGWPFRTIPALPFKYLPKEYLIKSNVINPKANLFKYTRN